MALHVSREPGLAKIVGALVTSRVAPNCVVHPTVATVRRAKLEPLTMRPDGHKVLMQPVLHRAVAGPVADKSQEYGRPDLKTGYAPIQVCSPPDLAEPRYIVRGDQVDELIPGC